MPSRLTVIHSFFFQSETSIAPESILPHMIACGVAIQCDLPVAILCQNVDLVTWFPVPSAVVGSLIDSGSPFFFFVWSPTDSDRRRGNEGGLLRGAR